MFCCHLRRAGCAGGAGRLVVEDGLDAGEQVPGRLEDNRLAAQVHKEARVLPARPGRGVFRSSRSRIVAQIAVTSVPLEAQAHQDARVLPACACGLTGK